MREPTDKDYVEGNYVVFKDNLELTDYEKQAMEETAVLTLTSVRDNVFLTSAGEHEALAVERRKRPDGTDYVLVRKATTREAGRFYAGEPSIGRRSYEEPQGTGPIRKTAAAEALDFLVEIEPNPDDCQSLEEYNEVIQSFEPSMSVAKRTLRRFAQDLRAKTIEDMRKAYYVMLVRYKDDSSTAGVAGSYLSDAMHGIAGWMK